MTLARSLLQLDLFPLEFALACLLFGLGHTLVAAFLGENAQGLGDRGAVAFGLDQGLGKRNKRN